MKTGRPLRFGITLAHTHTAIWTDTAVLADELGFDSVWLPDHLVFPVVLDTSGYPGDDRPDIAPDTPLFDCPAYLSYLAARTARIRLGTYVYVYALRHPLVAARGFATADLLAEGRIEVGVGAGWLQAEWDAAGADFATRGARLDEAIEVTRRLWADDVIEHHGTFWSWDPVRFEPKPHQPGGPPILVGGESRAALRRAAALGDGWLSMPHTLESIGPQLELLAKYRAQSGRADERFTVTACVLDPPAHDEVPAWEEAGVDRLIVRPWRRSRDTLEALRLFAERYADHLSR